MNKIKIFFGYIFSVFNPFGTDTGLHFFIKSILALIYGFTLAIIIPLMLNMIFISTGNYEIIGSLFITNTIITIIIMFGLQLIVAARRFRGLGKSQWSLIIYLLSMFTGFFGIIYWIYLCFTKRKTELETSTFKSNKVEL